MKNKKNFEYTSMKINIPRDLIIQFTFVSHYHHYSRPEAIKQAFREFIKTRAKNLKSLGSYAEIEGY